MNDDITFCLNGGKKECMVVRCERHPSNIVDRSIPHSYAELYMTEYCPIGQEVGLKPCPFCGGEAEIAPLRDAVIVRCKSCLNQTRPFSERPWEEDDEQTYRAIDAWNRRAR